MLKAHQKATIQAYNNSAENFDRTVAKLDNYDETYDYLLSLLKEGDRVLDLACGPGNISGYLSERKSLQVTGYDLAESMLEISRKRMPQGVFLEQSIIDFTVPEPLDMVINGFGLPYLHDDQVDRSLRCSYEALRTGGHIYLSFMDGDKEGFETTSFHDADEFYLLHHDKERIREKLNSLGFSIIGEWCLGYTEADGTITDDIIYVAQKK